MRGGGGLMRERWRRKNRREREGGIEEEKGNEVKKRDLTQKNQRRR